MKLPQYLRAAGSIAVVLVGAVAQTAFAQGQDSTPGERHLRVMAELLPGQYDNINQNYFDTRRNLPEADRHVRIHTTIARVQAPAFMHGNGVLACVRRAGKGLSFAATGGYTVVTAARAECTAISRQDNRTGIVQYHSAKRSIEIHRQLH